MKNHSVVLAGDSAYIRQIETALKSLCYHNSHVKVYIFNQDIPKEWFSALRPKLQQMGGDLVDVKMLGPQFQMNWSNKLPHINHMTFARYFIPDFVEEDKVLYLDSDLVVTADLTPLFEMDLGDNYLAAAASCFGAGIGFNAGVLLINNKKWRAEAVRQKLVELTDREHQHVSEGDQSILNMLFQDSYIPLDHCYNFQIGFDSGAALHGHEFIFDIPLKPLPAILHYLSPDKPWNTYSVGRLREIWWHYHLMEWSTITEKWRQAGLAYPVAVYQPVMTCVTLTNSWCLEKIDYLVQALPKVHFYIAAYTMMAPELMLLSRFENVTLYPNTFPLLVERLIQQADVYLDINHDKKLSVVYDYVSRFDKPLLTFENTKAQELAESAYAGIFSAERPEEMVVALKAYLEEKSQQD